MKLLTPRCTSAIRSRNIPGQVQQEELISFGGHMRSKLVLGLCLFLSAAVLQAQTISTSQIRGVIQDPSGGAVAGAEIRLTQTATGAVRTATSATDGSYTLPDLSVGSYQMEVTMPVCKYLLKPGFVTYI